MTCMIPEIVKECSPVYRWHLRKGAFVVVIPALFDFSLRRYLMRILVVDAGLVNSSSETEVYETNIAWSVQ